MELDGDLAIERDASIKENQIKVLFQNHSSLLLQYNDRYLLTDPWYNTPAFGSWLPSFTPYIHPTYLASLGERLTILVSHGHDDHIDDRLLGIFDKKTKIVTADFKAPSVVNRLKKLGFENISTVSEDETEIDGLAISSYIVEEFSHDDATYLIRNNDGAVIHTNDNWREFEVRHEQLIKKRISSYSTNSVLLFTQTNSASGYPLNYRSFSDDEKISILRSKVAGMVEAGLLKAEKLNLSRIFSYAGFASAYVKDKEYENLGLFPTADFLRELLHDEGISSSVEITDFYPGDSIVLPGGEIIKAFVNGYSDQSIKGATNNYYHTYQNIKECMSYREINVDESALEEWLEDFLSEFSQFTASRVEGADAHYTNLIGKTFSIEVDLAEEKKIRKTIRMGSGLVSYEESPNKHCFVNCASIFSILAGDSLFEDLYTGYNAEWSRNPPEVYNRDIVMMIVMFSYVYRNRLSQKYKEKHLPNLS